MSKKSDLLFKTSSIYGDLYYHNVYSFYEQPLIFTAYNENDQLFFCYDLGVDESNELWIFAPISEEKVRKLENKDIPIVSALIQNKNYKAILYMEPFDDSPAKESLCLVKDLPYQWPNLDVFIHENINYDNRRKHTHKIRINKPNSKAIDSSILNGANDSFGYFCKNVWKKHDIPSKILLHDAIPGSFIYRVEVQNKDTDKEEVHEILNRLSNKDDFIHAIDEKELDLRLVKRLFDEVLSHRLTIQLIDEESTDIIIELTEAYVYELIDIVDDRLGTYLDSSMVPQADNFETLRLFLTLTKNKGFVTASDLGVHQRQVSYYRDACELLALVHDYSKLTPLGLDAVSSSNKDFVSIIKTQFMHTECGSIWMLNQGVKDLLDINGESATDFLIQFCNGLSEGTAKRRAQTLKSWVRNFKEFK
ncbi:DUF6575 domain-containing protein [Colwellia sp. RE-S-Sl-9]